MRWSERARARYERDRAAGGAVDILAIESSCDETAAAVVRNGRTVRSSVVASQALSHSRFGGVVPEVAARAHVEQITRVIGRALDDAGASLPEMSAVAVTCAPGLIGALFVGVTAAKTLAQTAGLPLIGVHHLAGHLYAAAIGTDLSPPFLALIASGGHTELLRVDADGALARLGRTRDDAAGEAFDKVARALGLGYPGGPAVEAAARAGDPEACRFPRARLEEGSLDFSFSGLKSAVLLEWDRRSRSGADARAADLAAGFQAAVVDMLADKARLALRAAGLKTLVLAGGVASNAVLRARLEEVCRAEGARLFAPPPWLCTDNAAMIGAAAHPRYTAGRLDDLALTAQASLSVERWWPPQGENGEHGGVFG